MKGGARARSGPPADPNALRRDRDGAEWTVLPAKGRAGRAPKWPLTPATARERQLWAEEWKRPQAIMWERNGQALEVALYVRAVVDAESPRAPVAARTLVRQMMDSLGLSVPGLRANRWRILAEDEEAAARPPAPTRQRAASSVKDRLEVLQGGASTA